MNGIDRVVEIERLAALDPMDYEVVRTTEAERLGFRTEFLDRAVKKKRRALGLEKADDDSGQGQAVKMDDLLPWAYPIEGDRVASSLSATIKRYAVLPDEAADAIALWVLLSWKLDGFSIAPRLAVTSPTKGCGKTTVLRLLTKLARRPLKTGSVTPAALFRAVEQLQPTLILDENEKYLEAGGDLHALLNEGHARGATVLRVLGDNMELRAFNVFGLVAFARNGKIPDDLEQRSIVVEMQRRLAHEPLDEIRDDRCEHLRNLARMCARWADDVSDLIRDHDPDMGGLINRVADNWRPLFAIADMIGDDWPDRAREAAASLMPKEVGSIGPMLLEDIKAAFNDRDRISSSDICAALNALEGRPWGDWKGKSLTANQLARLLKPFGIRSDNVRIGSQVPKGYTRQQFEESWTRYLAHARGHTPHEPLHRYNADETGTSATFKALQDTPDVAVQQCEKTPANGHCSVVAVQNPPEAADGKHGQVCGHCGEPEDIYPVAYGDVEAAVHPYCRDAWVAARDDLSIPPYLDRRGEEQP